MKKIIPNGANLVPRNAKRVFKGEIYDVYQWPQKMYDGSVATFEMLKRPDTVVVLAIKDDKFVVLRQQQPGINGEFLDFPGGRADEGETPLESAERELLEETGMKFRNWKLLEVKQASWKIEQFIYTYLATGFKSETDTNHDNGEKIELDFMAFDEVLKNSDDQIRLNVDLLKKYGSLEGLLNAPEFEGREIEV